ncbi:conserved hypothetical protein [Vibrio phage 501E54-1]|nr:conserved hypothetical protein [Vibrio phage 501E54-1]
MAYQELKIWSSTEMQDPVKGNSQINEILEEKWIQGWGRLHGVSAQDLNTLFRIITEYSPPTDYCAYPHPANVTVPSTAIESGSSITAEDQPELFKVFGNTLPDMSASNLPNFIWVFRNH